MTQVINIPPEYKKGFSKLQLLNEDALKTFLAVLKEEHPRLLQSDWAAHVASHIPGIEARDVTDMVSALLGLYYGREATGLSISDFVDALTHSSDFAITDELPKNTFKRYLAQLLEVDSLIVTSKAFDVLTEHEHTVHSLRIITDLRPIFKENLSETPSASPAAAVITHTLKVSYHRGRGMGEFFLALDDDDLDLLKALIRRAEAKETSLKELLTVAKVRCVETKTNE